MLMKNVLWKEISLRSNQKLIKNVEDILNQRKMVGEASVMISLKENIKKYSQSNINILIRGASGTGKELVAYNIHYQGPRKFENFVPINCGSLPHDLVESELFGYEKGAFTGADKKKLGLFEIADNGTIFLDEITELPLSAQVKLLRVIQEGEIEKIGRTEKIKVNVRVLAATNKNIEDEVKAKRFREDLYYRLNVVPIIVSELIDRKTDIPILIDHFMSIYSIDMGKEKPTFTPEAMKFLINYRWPGNVRELKNIVQRLLFTGETTLTLPIVEFAVGLLNQFKDDRGLEVLFEENEIPLNQMEKIVREKYFRYIRNKTSSDTEAAKKLGLAPSNYYRMAKELGLK